MNLLGIDYGTEHIGVALGSTESGLAEPLATLSSRQSPEGTIQSLVSKHGIRKIIIGVSEKISAKQAKQFADQLKQYANIPIELADETLSSKEAIEKLSHKSLLKRGTLQHAAAAAVILQRWLDSPVNLA